MESEESYLIELPHRRADAICAEFNRDFDRLADSLQVLNRRLVLLHPVSACWLTYSEIPGSQASCAAADRLCFGGEADAAWGVRSRFAARRGGAGGSVRGGPGRGGDLQRREGAALIKIMHNGFAQARRLEAQRSHQRLLER